MYLSVLDLSSLVLILTLVSTLLSVTNNDFVSLFAFSIIQKVNFGMSSVSLSVSVFVCVSVDTITIIELAQPNLVCDRI